MKSEKVSCIMLARNEAQRIESVLRAISDCHLLGEIIVVQSFSTDNTSEVVRKFIKKNNAKKVRLVEDDKYPGKAYAMYLGAKMSKNSTILFLDADLIGLTHKNLDDLIMPILKNEADITIAYMKDAIWFYKIFGVDPVCGQRAMRKSLFLKMKDSRHSKAAIESIQNEFLMNSGKRIKIVKMPNVTQKMKYKKAGFFKGWYYEMHAIKQVLAAVPLRKFIKILIFLSKKNKKD